MQRILVGIAIITAGLWMPAKAIANDEQIAEQIIQKLEQHKQSGDLNGFGVNLQVQDGIVWLQGNVSTQDQRNLILEVARRIRGVKQVVNDIDVKSHSSPAVAESTKPRTRNAFAGINSAMKEAFTSKLEPASTASASSRRGISTSAAMASPATQVANQHDNTLPHGSRQVQGRNDGLGVKQPLQQAPTESIPVAAAKSQASAVNPNQTTALSEQMNSAPNGVATIEQTEASGSTAAIPRRSLPASVATAAPKATLAAAPTPLQAQVAAGANDGAVPVPTALVPVPVYGTQRHPQPETLAHAPSFPPMGTGVRRQTALPAMARQAVPAPPVAVSPNAAAGIAVGSLIPVPVIPVYPAAGQGHQTPLAFAPAHGTILSAAHQAVGRQDAAVTPIPAYLPSRAGGVMPIQHDHPQLPAYAWPSYAAYPNYGAVSYPKQYSPTAWPYIGPFYPYPQVPLGWRKVTLKWKDGWWMLDFKDRH